MERLSGLDAGFVYAETPSWHMHAGALIVLDPSTTPDRFDIGRFRSLVASRRHLLGPFLHRLVEVPFGLDRPVWINDPHLDLNRQVRRVGVPPPGGPRELGALVGELFGYQLEGDRPLWEIWFIEGLEHGHVGLLVKVHHSLVDGARGARLYEVLFDLAPDAPFERPGVPVVRGERIPSELEMLLRSVPRLFGTPVRMLRTAGRLGSSAVRMVGFRRSPEWRQATFPFQAPRTSLNQPITSHRDFAFCAVPLAEVKSIKDTFGVTVNDVVLALCAGALRTYLSDRGELPDKPLVAQIPVAVHAEGGPDPSSDTWGNQIAVMGAVLGTHLNDPAERLQAIHDSTRSAKTMHKALGEDLLLDLADPVPPGVLAAGVRSYRRLRLAEHHPPIFNLIMSSVKGPPVPLYVAGARLIGTYPMGPLLDGGGLNITVISCLEEIDFGFVVCPEVVEDPWSLADATLSAFVELRKAAKQAV
jgi:WS/DGAT/MGAT family acyltransferase